MRRDTSLPGVTRRLFLQRSVLALAATLAPALSHAVAASPATGAPLATPALLAFSADDYRLLSVVSEAFIPSEPDSPGARTIDLAARIDRYTSPQDESLIQGVRGALLFIENTAPELIGETRKFSQLDPANQEKVLLALNTASALTTMIFVAVRGLCLFYFYTDEAGWKEMGYDGPLVSQSNRPQQTGA